MNLKISSNGKLAGISVLNDKGTIVKKMFYSFLISILNKYSFSVNTFWTQLVPAQSAGVAEYTDCISAEG